MKNKFDILREAAAMIDVKASYRSHDHLRDLVFWTRRTVRVLVLVDEFVSIGEHDGFGVGRFIKLLRNTSVGCTYFQVDIARRPPAAETGVIAFEEIASPGDFEAKYIDFRFDSTSGGQLVLNRYHEVFLFGFAPDNNADGDGNITSHPWHSTDAELRVLMDWMNQGGGVFATGDHDYLGASMCHRIPRVGSMRKWTNADGVPPIDGPTRLDTNQPATPDQESGTDVIPISVEMDSIPQHIQWVPDRIVYQGVTRIKYPHRILCHPVHGPINVMPDHPHEGCCEDPATINYAATVAFGSENEYPDHNGSQPKPKIIAYGNVQPMLNQQKGAVNAAHFPMISVYDGRSNGSDVGRVVVDSTWHHWFNLNIGGLEAATDQTNWEKISRYYINVALWIAPKSIAHGCYWEFVKLHFEYTGLRAINKKTNIWEVGVLIRQALWYRFGKCWTIEFIFTHICKIRPALCQYYKRYDPWEKIKWPRDIRDIIQPQYDVIEILVLGHIYRSVEEMADKLRFALSSKDKKSELHLEIEQVEKMTIEGITRALEEIDKMVDKDLSELTRAFKKK